MTPLTRLSRLFTSIFITFIATIFLLTTPVNPLGSASTFIVTDNTTTVCGIIAGEPAQRILCFQDGEHVTVLPNVSFQAISGGRNFFCGLRSDGLSLHCWDTNVVVNSTFQPRRLYYNRTVRLTDVAVGDDQVCAREVNSGLVRCWRGRSSFPSPDVEFNFKTITSGSGFTCGILSNNSEVYCWGENRIGDNIQRQFGNLSMSTLVAGESHACGLDENGHLVCKGNNNSGQLNVPFSSAYEFSGLALGANFSCAIRERNGLITCWGDSKMVDSEIAAISDVSFESIVAGVSFICGLTTRNFSIICWGPGWLNAYNLQSVVPLGMIIPGPCVESSCNTCGVYPNSESLCDGSGYICRSCQIELPLSVPLPSVAQAPSPVQHPYSSPTKPPNKLSLIFIIVGSVGAFAGICAVVYCLCAGVYRLLHNRIYSSDHPSIAAVNMANNGSNLPSLRTFSITRQGSKTLGRQRSGSSYSSRTDKTEIFSLSELAAATNSFSSENKIGSGSFGSVYKGKLQNGREVAIKRGENYAKIIKSKEKESAFESELALSSRLHHKHLLGLIGYCEEKDERLLVYEYMSNGALHDHLHNQSYTGMNSNILNSWKMRIKIALDAARGLEYLHNYAVPPIIHRDIKSSNILLDANWTARVSDFGLSLLTDQGSVSTKAVGTFGYIDPEYYVLNVLTSKTDIYGLGVVLLELVTGKKAVFKNEYGTAKDLVAYAEPEITAGHLNRVLDKRVAAPDINEREALEVVAAIAIQCVNLEGKERPSVTDIVATLERALVLYEDTNAVSFSTTTFSFPSDRIPYFM
ncbi:putative serine/threonine-protein kinase-like protein CCR3 [Mangifera indica]|uniref:putative serine/threonine-protein kinase-like protein CCR3 n=1 Tax=Mangifera indica TaxID=29780 RepID=UPI001CFAD303|nr:putative serine/threonine-protein kinase-like protein CCR3 [Mangifera indica]